MLKSHLPYTVHVPNAAECGSLGPAPRIRQHQHISNTYMHTHKTVPQCLSVCVSISLCMRYVCLSQVPVCCTVRMGLVFIHTNGGEVGFAPTTAKRPVPSMCPDSGGSRRTLLMLFGCHQPQPPHRYKAQTGANRRAAVRRCMCLRCTRHWRMRIDFRLSTESFLSR